MKLLQCFDAHYARPIISHGCHAEQQPPCARAKVDKACSARCTVKHIGHMRLCEQLCHTTQRKFAVHAELLRIAACRARCYCKPLIAVCILIKLGSLQ